MPFLAYVLVMIVAVGSVLFGVEVVTSPPRKPATEVTSPANKLTQHEADQRAEKTEGDVSRSLTPLYPANPAGTKDVRVVYPPSNQAAADQTTGTAPADEPKPKTETASEPKVEPKVEPKAESNAEPKADVAITANNSAPASQKPQIDERPAAKPVKAAVHASNHCDVQACARAYSSFRVADCSYQPFEGPRHACIAPPAQRSAENVRREEAAPARTKERNEVELRPAEPENAAMDEDDDDDAAGFMRGRRVIILDRNYRPY
jgi:hypothetical protein